MIPRTRRLDAGLSIILFVLAMSTALSQQGIDIHVIRRDIDSVRNEEVFLCGYDRSVKGATIAYHSCHPEANSALLARARRGDNEIAWMTDTIPKNIQGNFYFFVWIAGIEKEGFRYSSGSYKFDLSINGRRWFTFRNLKDDRARKWNVPGRDGARLSFDAVWSDGPGDLFGYMTMKVPKDAFPEGAPLRIDIRGEESQSADWYMTFEYRFNFQPGFRVEPALLKGVSGPSQVVRISLDNLLPRRSVTVISSGGDTIRQDLRIGSNLFDMAIPTVSAPAKLPYRYFIDDAQVLTGSFTVPPVRRREIYLLPFSHNDIGYTDLQPNVERRHHRHLAEALKLIKSTGGYPPEARFRWNFEVLWPLDSYLQILSRRSQEDFFASVADGSIGLNGFYANMLTGLAGAREMGEFFRMARSLNVRHDLRIASAVISDIPGFSWGVVQAMAQSGIRYFLSAPNASDRVGHIYEHLGDKPFWWKSPSGTDSVLFFLAGAGYSSFHESDLPTMGGDKLFRMLRAADAREYPFDMLVFPYTIGGDNGPPDPHLSDFVRDWNERYESPTLIISTVETAMREFEARHGSTLPSRSGDFTPYWEDGAYSTASETILNRRSADRMIQAEAISAMIPESIVPQALADDAWRHILLFDEHTWGAHNSVSEPDDPTVRRMWALKREFALQADTLSRAVLDSTLRTIARPIADEPCIQVVNTLPWTRSDVVTIPAEWSVAGDRAADENGAVLRSQRLSTGELAVFVANLHPYSSRKIFVQPGKHSPKGAAALKKRTISNALLSVDIDTLTGAVKRLASKRWKKPLSTPSGLNRYIYVPGTDATKRKHLSGITFRAKESGGLVASCVLTGVAPGCSAFSTEVRVMDGVNRVEFINRLDKTAVREKESIHFAFPFGVTDAIVRYDVAGGIARVEDDQLPGSCRNYVSTTSFIDASSVSSGVTVASPDVALMQIGDIRAEQPWLQSLAPSSSIYSYVLNNYWHTNYKADQEGPVTVRYSLQPHGPFAPDEAIRFAREQREPLLVLPSSSSIPAVAPLVSPSPASFIIESIARIDSGRAWLMHVRNAAETPQRLSLAWRDGSEIRIFRSDAAGTVRNRADFPLPFAAKESMYVRVEPQ